MNHPRIIPIFLLIITLNGCGAQERTKPKIEPSPTTITPEKSKVDIIWPGIGDVSVMVANDEETDPEDAFPHDRLAIYVRATDGRLVGKHAFVSTYQDFKLDVLDLDADNEPEFILIKGTGRGTSARAEFLQVLSMAKGRFCVRLESPYSAYFGVGSTWQYSHTYEDFNRDGVMDIRMDLTHTPIGESAWEAPDDIPSDRVRILSIMKP